MFIIIIDRFFCSYTRVFAVQAKSQEEAILKLFEHEEHTIEGDDIDQFNKASEIAEVGEGAVSELNLLID